jgi:hypothetical protein
MRRLALVGRYETALLNGKRIVVLGNLMPVIFAGLLMGPYTRAYTRKTGAKKKRIIFREWWAVPDLNQ